MRHQEKPYSPRPTRERPRARIIAVSNVLHLRSVGTGVRQILKGDDSHTNAIFSNAEWTFTKRNSKQPRVRHAADLDGAEAVCADGTLPAPYIQECLTGLNAPEPRLGIRLPRAGEARPRAALLTAHRSPAR